MAGYDRQSSADIIPGATVRAAPINSEYNQLDAAFAAITGHKHDGTDTEGGYVPLIADYDAKNKVIVDTATNTTTFYTEVAGVSTAQLVVKDGAIVPSVDNDIDLGSAVAYFKDAYIKGNLKVAAISATGDVTPSADGTYDLGSSTLEWQDLWIDGEAHIDTLTVDENATVTGNLTVNGNTTIGNAATDTVTVTAKVATSLVPNVDNAVDLGSATNEWKDLYIDGVANIDSLVADTADINAGTIDNTTIGATTPTSAKFSVTDIDQINIDGNTISSTDTDGNINLIPDGNGKVVTAKVDINGGSIDGVTIGTASAVTDLRVDNIKVDANTISSTNANGDINLSPDGTGKVVTSKVDINGGAIDGTPIGGTTRSSGNFTTVSSTSGISGNLTGNVTGNVTATSGTTSLYGLSVTNNMTMNSKVISSVADPALAQDAATKKYVDDTIAAVIDTAPDALNTLNEIAAALGDDADFTTNVYSAIGGKVAKTGDTMTGALSMNSNKITDLATPTNDYDAATKKYIDDTYIDYSTAANAAYDAEKLAINPEDSQYTLSDGTTTGYSALHYAAKVAATYDQFDDRYLGDKATDPTTDNDGNALVTGAMYFDSTNAVMKVYNGTQWQAASSSISGIKQDFMYTATEGQTVFDGADDNAISMVIDKADLVSVYYNGVRLTETADYTIDVSLDKVTLTFAAEAGDVIEAEVFGNFAGQSGAEVNITGGEISGLTSLDVTGTTTLAGATTSADINFGDNDKAIFGAGSDLQIYHDGQNSIITDQGSGTLKIQGDSQVRLESTAGDRYFVGNNNGAVRLYYDDTEKLATTSTGIDVTGTATMDGLTVENTTGALDVYFNSADANAVRLNLGDQTNASTGMISYNNSTDNLLFNTNGSEAMRIDSSGSVGIGTTTPSFPLHIDAGTLNTALFLESTDPVVGIYFKDDTTTSNATLGLIGQGDDFRFMTSGSEAMRIDSSGNVGIGKTSPSEKLDVNGHMYATRVRGASAAGSALPAYAFDSHTATGMFIGGDDLAFTTNGNERMRINATSGKVQIGMTDGIRNFNVAGSAQFNGTFRIADKDVDITVGDNLSTTTGCEISTAGTLSLHRDGSYPINLNRSGSDGTLIVLRAQGNIEGSISASGTTISYNGGHLSRWSRLPEGTDDSNILKGTVMTNLNAMCEWRDEAGDLEDNEQLNQVTVSSVEGDKNVAGVFVSWDEDDDWGDFYLAQTGDMVIRIAAGTTVEQGDLLMSAGDGTAKPQEDDIVRSKTIAKVTSTHVSFTYDDGSYCVPCVLMAC